MKIKKEISSFLGEYPLYRKFEINERVISPYDFHGYTFNFFCKDEGKVQTFELELPPPTLKHYGQLTVGRTPENCLIDGKVNFIEYYNGRCRSCKDYIIQILLHCNCESISETSNDSTGFTILSKTTLKKIGQFPPFEIKT